MRNFEIRDAQKLQTVRAVCQQSQHDISFLWWICGLDIVCQRHTMWWYEFWRYITPCNSPYNGLANDSISTRTDSLYHIVVEQFLVYYSRWKATHLLQCSEREFWLTTLTSTLARFPVTWCFTFTSKVQCCGGTCINTLWLKHMVLTYHKDANINNILSEIEPESV